MEPEVVVNKIIRDMVGSGLIAEEAAGEVRIEVQRAWTAGYDYRGKELQAHNKSKIIQFNMQGIKIGEYNSVVEAAKQPGYHPIYGRNTIFNVLNGKYKHTKQGHVYKYAEK